MSRLKKIFIFALVSYFLFPIATMAATCCVCKTCDEEGCSNLTPLLLYGNNVTTTQKCFRALSTCELKEDPGCQLTVEAAPTMTKLEDEFKFSDMSNVLGIKIPNLKFSAPPTEVDSEGNIYLPWIGEYLKAVYDFALVAISIVAVVVLIIQGARIIISAGGPEKSAAYKGIAGAVIGLFIAWGSYAILYSINPDLTQFTSLKILFIPEDPLKIELGTTEIDTIDPLDKPVSGSFKATFPNCPITLTDTATFVAPHKEPRTLEFYKKVGSIIKTTSPTEKVVQIAEAAAKCGVHLGSCGRTAGTILALAGVVDPTCLQGGKKGKGCLDVKGKTVFAIPQSDRKWLSTVKCNAKDSKGVPITPMSPCANTQKEARQIVYDKFKKMMPANWPDSVANSLQPGDYVIVYNGNSSLRGTHAALFIGWGSGGRAQVIQGSWGRVASIGTVCIKSECSSPEALMEITRP